MKRIDLTIHLPFLVNRPLDLNNPGIACSFFESELHTVLFIEAPNWANAYEWGPAAALLAWKQWEKHPERLNSHNPADLENFSLYRLRPGFPNITEVWKEPFTFYEPFPRALTLVQRLLPVSGTGLVREQSPQNLTDIFSLHGIPIQDLKFFTSAGTLKPRA